MLATLESAHIDTCTVYNLPGGTWFYLLGPQNSQAKIWYSAWRHFQAARWPHPTATLTRKRSSIS